jgi:hypothetical protein
VAVIHLEFDVDSDVHPELHAMLSSIGNGLSQGERLRQLAATGLVWEAYRLQGQLSSPFVAPVDQAVDAGAAPAAVPSSSDPPPAPREIEHDVESAARELPVLFDVVHPDEATRLIAVIGKHSANSPAAGSDPVPVPAIPHKTPTRPRLKRMKEKGLFKNG